MMIIFKMTIKIYDDGLVWFWGIVKKNKTDTK